MGISCHCGESENLGWYFDVHDHPEVLSTRRSRRCVSCRTHLRVGDSVYRITRFRSPKSWVEERIYGDEVDLALWFFCPSCFAIWSALDRLNVCVDLGQDNLRDCLNEFNALYAPKGFFLKVSSLPEIYASA